MLRDLIDKRARLYEQANGVLRKAGDEKREMTTEEVSQFDLLHEEMDKLGVTITRLERQATVEAELQRSTGRQADPGRPGAMVPARDDPPRAAPVIETTEADRLEALRTWLLAASDQRPRLTQHQIDIARRVGCDINVRQVEFILPDRAVRRLGDADQWETRPPQATTPGAVGGYTIPDETMRALERALLEFGGMRQVSTIIRTDTGADMPIPTNNDTMNEGHILGENLQVEIRELTFNQLVLQSYKYSARMVLVSVELMQDNAVNLAGILGGILGERIGRITNRHFTTGTGTAEPMGILTAASQGVVATTGGATSATYDNFVDLEHSVDPAYRTGARFMFHDSTLKTIKKLKDTTGRPLWVPGMAFNSPDTIFGYPFTVNQSMPVLGANAKSILFGQLTKYLIRDVRGVTLLRLDERFADFHQVAFLAFARYDGDLLDAGTHPVKYFQNSAT